MPLRVNAPVASAVMASPLVFTFLSSLASNTISGYLAASSHLSLSMCCCCMELPTCNEAVATTILPLVAAGFAGSKVTVPEMPVALPLSASSGASSLNVALFTPLGSLKSNVSGAARAALLKQASASRRWILVFMCLLQSQINAKTPRGKGAKKGVLAHPLICVFAPLRLCVGSYVSFEFVFCGTEMKRPPGCLILTEQLRESLY